MNYSLSMLVFVLAAATLLQAAIFAVLLLTERFKAAVSVRFLVAELALIAAAKIDQLYQMAGGLISAPAFGFALSPLQSLITPALYFFVRARTGKFSGWTKRDALHLAPAAIYFFYLFAIYFRLPFAERIELVETGGLSGWINAAFVPIGLDVLQLCYVAAAFAALKARGLELSRWFSRIDDKAMTWMRPLLALWGAALVLHAAVSLFRIVGGFDVTALVLVMNVAQFLFVPVLVMLAVTDQPSAAAASPPMRYASSSQSDEDRKALYARADGLLRDGRLFLEPELCLHELADRLAAPPRELSEALNGVGEENFFVFVNRRRIEYAKELLLTNPGKRILDVALESGFNSKSTFNDAFRRHAGTSPSVWRRTSLIRAAPSFRAI
jgi:AraC-like DNA-binding protein